MATQSAKAKAAAFAKAVQLEYERVRPKLLDMHPRTLRRIIVQMLTPPSERRYFKKPRVRKPKKTR